MNNIILSLPLQVYILINIYNPYILTIITKVDHNQGELLS